MSTTLIKNATIVTVDRSLGVLKHADLLIDGERIADVRPAIDVRANVVLDASDMIVMPGLINAHLHTWETVLRGIGADWRGHEYFQVLLGRLGPLFTPDDMYLSTLLGALNQLDSGCTTIFDWCHTTTTPDHCDAAIEGLQEAGIRAVFGHGTPKPNPTPGQPHFSTLPFPRDSITRLRRGRFAANDDGLLSLAMCILGPDYAALDINRHDFLLARELDLLTSAHVWGGARRRTEGGYRTLVGEGLMEPRHNAVHANFLDDEEVKLLVDQGASITATPSIEVGVPRAPVISAVIQAGGHPSIAIDTEVKVSGNMFDILRSASQLQGAFDSMAAYDEAQWPVSSGRPDVDAIVRARRVRCDASDVLEWATINNARALGIDDRTGSLTPGKQADVVLLRATDLNLLPALDPVQSIVVHANHSNVDTVFVAGQAVKQAGALGFDQSRIAGLRERTEVAAARLLGLAEEMGHPLLAEPVAQ